MSEHHSALVGLTFVLALLERMICALDERMVSPTASLGVLPRLYRLMSGKALADQARFAVWSMVRAKFAVLASHLAASLAADLHAHATDGAPASMPTDLAACAAAASMAAAPAAQARKRAAECDTLHNGATAMLAGSGTSDVIAMTCPRDADTVMVLRRQTAPPGLDLKFVSTAVADFGGHPPKADEGDGQAPAMAANVRRPALTAIGASWDARNGGQAAAATAASSGVSQTSSAAARSSSAMSRDAKRDALPRRASWR